MTSQNKPYAQAKLKGSKSIWVYVNSVFWLSVNFIKAAVLSGFSTGRLILFPPKDLQGGICEWPYQDLSGYPLAILGMMITLTPGTTTIDVDIESQTLHLHLLDLSQKQQVFEQIEKDYLRYLLVWSLDDFQGFDERAENQQNSKNKERG